MTGIWVLVRLCFFNFIMLMVLFPTCILAVPPTAPKVSKAYFIDHSDSFYRDSENGFTELEGNVQIIINQQHISCDQAMIDEKTKTIEASGHVVLLDPKVHIEAASLMFNYDTGLGTIYKGFVQAGQVVFEGDLIHKTGPEEYIIDKGQYTACTTCPAAWSFTGSSIRAQIGGYAYIKNSILKFANLPSFWFPYIVVPLKTSRQTGLLPPKFGLASSTNFNVSQSFFWAMDRSYDSTFTYTQNSKWRKLDLNYRYILDKNSKGNLDAGFVYEKVQSTDSDKKIKDYDPNASRVNRWFIKYDHYFELPEGFIQRSQINLISDLQYPKDFPLDTKNHGDPAAESRISITKNTTEQHLSLDSSYYINLLKDNPHADNKDAVHRFPELKYSIVEKRVSSTNAFFNLDLNYVNFARDYYTYDDITKLRSKDQTSYNGNKFISNDKNNPNCPNGPGCVIARDGKFDETERKVGDDPNNYDIIYGPDQIRTGQRFDFQPTLSYPMKVGRHIELLPSLTYRFSRYSFGVGSDPDHDRQNLRTKLSARTSFNRIFGDLADTQSTRYKHELQPEIILSTMPWVKQSNHHFFSQTADGQEVPFFKTSSAISDDDINGINGLQFDYTDRLYDRKLVTFVFNNKLTRKIWTPAGSDYQRIAGFRLSQSYDANEAESRKELKRPWSNTTGIIYVRMSQVDLYSVFNYYPYHRVIDSSDRIRFNDTLGNWIQFGLTHKYQPQELSNDGSFTTEDYSFATGFQTKHVDLVGLVNYSNITYKVTSWQYTATLKVPGNCWGFVFTHQQPIGADPNLSFNMYFSFDGQTVRTINDSNLGAF